MSRSLFDPLADAYDAARPSYPAGLYDDLERLTRPLAGADVLEVGAGTGISTRGLLERGARVYAADHGEGMLRRLRSHPGAAPAVVADAHALPFRDAVADLVCYAQAWHWVRVPEAAAEVVRVLRPDGALACWWNDESAGGQPWWEAQQARLEAGNVGYSRGYRDNAYADQLAQTGLFGPVQVAETTWSREIDLETYLVWLSSKSYVAALGAGQPAFMAAERASMAAAFPSGVVHESFRTTLYVAAPAG
ncbi:MAG: class I SAM-dependent methyltransferase [Actinomycetota bacterium]|nr:class I SAM-dependent methyltransferase [Actinomycetota bacterium]